VFDWFKLDSICPHCYRQGRLYRYCIPGTTELTWGCKDCERKAFKERRQLETDSTRSADDLEPVLRWR
jgi:uncharacterized protein (DUF983 family)